MCIRDSLRSVRKQDRPGHHLEDIFIPSFLGNRKHDPVWALKLYLKSVEGRRGNLKSLFSTFGSGPVKSLTAHIIVHWLVDAIQQGMKANLKVCVHFLRKVSITNVIRAAK